MQLLCGHRRFITRKRLKGVPEATTFQYELNWNEVSIMNNFVTKKDKVFGLEEYFRCYMHTFVY